MIIRKLLADNLLKFERLELTGLPEKGVIAVSGANESGKSAILEAICLALFGRSFALEAGSTAKVVRWGAATAGVEMEFTGRDGSDYIVVRHFDTDGRQRARFGKKRSRFPLRGLEAVNPAVREVVGFDFPRFVETLYLPQKRNERQEGPTSLAAMAGTIRALAGVEELEEVRRAYGVEVADGQRAITRLAEQLTQLEGQLRQLNLDPPLLGRLQTRLQEEHGAAEKAGHLLSQWQTFAGEIAGARTGVGEAVAALTSGALEITPAEWQTRLQRLDQSLEQNRRNCLEHSLVEVEKDPGLELGRWIKETRNRLADLDAILEDVTLQRQGMALWLGEHPPGQDEKIAGYPGERQRILAGVVSCQRWRRWHGVGSFLTVAAAAAVWGGWVGVTRFPEMVAPYLPRLQALLPFWDPARAEQPMIIASGLSVVAALWLGRYLHQRQQVAGSSAELARLEARATRERQMAGEIDASSALPLPQRLATLGGLAKSSWIDKLNDWRSRAGAPLLDPEEWAKNRQRLNDFFNRFLEEMDGLAQDVAHQAEESRLTLGRHQSAAAKLQEQIRQEEARHQEAHRLQGQRAGVVELTATEERAIRLRQAGTMLLEGASRELFIAFNLELRRHLARIIPLFTDGRFQHLQIGDDLQMTLYATEKEGFVELSEVSTGVQQQLLLALRFALAQALISRAIRAPQCIILDEPFAYFDRVRLLRAMQAMGQISGEMVQFWVTAQEFDPGLPVDVQLSCQQGVERLALSRK